MPFHNESRILELCSQHGDHELRRIAGLATTNDYGSAGILARLVILRAVFLDKLVGYTDQDNRPPEVLPTLQDLECSDQIKTAIAQLQSSPRQVTPEQQRPVVSQEVELCWDAVPEHTFNIVNDWERLRQGRENRYRLLPENPELTDKLLNAGQEILELKSLPRRSNRKHMDDFVDDLFDPANADTFETLDKTFQSFWKFCQSSNGSRWKKYFRGLNPSDRSAVGNAAKIVQLDNVIFGCFLKDSPFIHVEEQFTDNTGCRATRRVPSRFVMPTNGNPERIVIPTYRQLCNSTRLHRPLDWENASTCDNQPEDPSVTNFFGHYTPDMYRVYMQKLAKIGSTVNADNLAEAAARRGHVAIPDLRYRLPANADLDPVRFIQAIYSLVELVGGLGGHDGNLEQALASLFDPERKEDLSELEKVSSVFADFCIKSDDPVLVSLYETCNPASKNESSVLARIAMMYDVMLTYNFSDIRADNESPPQRGLIPYPAMRSAMQRRVVLPLEAQHQANAATAE